MAASDPKNLAIREFGSLNTQAERRVIGNQEFSWLQEYMPIGYGNMKLVPGPSPAISTITVPGHTIYYWISASLNAVNYVYCFLTNGSAYEVNTDSGTTVQIAAAGTFSSSGVRAAQWKNERILIVDPSHGYFSYDRTTLISYQNTVYNVNIDVAGGGFTTAPTITPEYGSATFTSTIGASVVSAIAAAGTGYNVGDILFVTGGTYTQQARVRVTSITAGTGAIAGAVLELPGLYTSAPANPVVVTGGYGTGATFNLGWALNGVTVTNRGNGYTTVPRLLINASTVAGSAIPIATAGNYTVAPANPVATTGGTGTGLTANMVYGLTQVIGIVTQQVLAAGIPVAAPLGYSIGDILTLTGGTFTTAATVQITNISTFYNGSSPDFFINYYYKILTPGSYTVWPASGIFGTAGGHGSGLQVGYDPINGNHPSVMGAVQAVVAASGSGYTNNDALTVVGGTSTVATTLTYKTGGSSFGAVISANLNLSISGSAIASYAGRVWIVTSARTVVFSSPDSHEDFLTSHGAGSFILTDEQMKSQITALKVANDYLYIAGISSMFIVSGVSLQTSQGGSPTTTFNKTNLTTSFGTKFPDAMLPHYRSMMYGSEYGWYMLTGVTPQKFSDPLDGFMNNVTLTGSANVTAGQCIIFGQLCECWLVGYTDPVTLVTTSTIIVFFNGKWFTSVQNASLKMITGSVYLDTPTLFGTNGSSIYRLFTESATPRTFRFETKMWDMGNPLVAKKALKVGMEITVQNQATFTVKLESERGSNSVTLSETQPGYYFAGTTAEAIGNYVGMTITGTATPGDTITALYMAYKDDTPWATTG